MLSIKWYNNSASHLQGGAAVDFWSRMLSGIADTILPKDLEEDALLLQMEESLREEKELWRARQNFLETGVARRFQN